MLRLEAVRDCTGSTLSLLVLISPMLPLSVTFPYFRFSIPSCFIELLLVAIIYLGTEYLPVIDSSVGAHNWAFLCSVLLREAPLL